MIVLVENYALPTYDIPAPVGVHFSQVGPSWIDPLVTFLKSGILPKDNAKAEKIRRKAPRFWLSEDQSYISAHIQDRTYCVFTLK